jgi:signal transduction histidine kinase
VRGDPRLLRRMVRNLLENAHRHGSGSPIEVAVASLPEGEGGARVAVMDRGPGVPESERKRVFEPFYRPEGHSEGRDGGVGLGLSLVQEIARHHGGTARCSPRPGGGTLFEVDLLGVSGA